MEISAEHIGYFADVDDDDVNANAKPTYDPYDSAPCLICGKSWSEDTVRTCSIRPGRSDKSFFYRIHIKCDDRLTIEEETALDERVLKVVKR